MKKLILLLTICIASIHAMFAQSGNVGINTLSPQARLHAVRNTSGGPLLSNALAIFEDNQHSFIHLSHVNNAESGILSGNQSTLIRSGIVFGMDSSILFRTGGNVNRMSIKQNGNVGINTLSPLARFHVNTGNVLFTGTNPLPGTPGNVPVSGAGVRLMWYTDKAAFRTGRVTDTQWDKDSIGLYSFATGINTIAKGESSFATGEGTVASGLFSVATGFLTSTPGIASISFGTSTIAGGSSSAAFGAYTQTTAGSSTAFGFTTLASGFCSTAFGQYSNAKGENSTVFGLINSALGEQSIATGFITKAKGNNSISIGDHTFAKPYASLVIGRFNDTTAISTSTWDPLDPVFIIGKGTADNARSNAVTVLKNGKTGINTNNPLAMLHVRDSSVLFTGPLTIPGTANPPVSGAGTRMMWYADKAAFRAGQVDGTNWDRDSVGLRSIAMGLNTKAKGFSSTALGSGTTAIGVASTSLGLGNSAHGSATTAMGLSTKAIGNISTSMGNTTTTRADQSTTMGNNTIARAFASLVIGRFNDTTTAIPSLFNWVDTDPAFVIGNGSANNARKNAFTVLKNGMTGINTSDPQRMLHVIRNSSSNGPIHSNAIAAFEDNQNAYLQFSHTNNREAGILSGNEVTNIRSGLIFGADSSFIMRAGGNNTRMIIKKNGYVGINTTTPLASFHVKDSSVLFTGLNILPATPANPPVSGAGTRFMWYPDKAAMRSGSVNGTQWNKDSIGVNSIAVGSNVKAKGFSSIALGLETTASGNAAVALGHTTTASGPTSTALGSQTLASGEGAFAIGVSTTASGYSSTSIGNFSKAMAINSFASGSGTVANGINSTSFGNSTRAIGVNAIASGNEVRARSFASFAVGQFNDTTSISVNTWELTDPVFTIGNGLSHNARQNAMTVLKNGNTGINTATPDAMLHISEGSGGNTYNGAAEMIIEDDAASYLQFSNPNSFESGILSGNSLTSLRSAIIFRPDSAVQIRAGGGTTRIHVRADGNIGVGTTVPQRLLHVSGGTGGNIFHSNSDMIIEDDAATYLQFSSLTADESGILSGNQVSSLRSALMFRPDSSVQIRTGGNNTRLAVSKNGDVGIGDNTPNARLHVSNGTGGGLYNAEADLIIEDNSQAYIQFSTPVNQEAGIFSGNTTMDIRSAIRFKSDSSIVATTGGTSTRLTISKTGNVAIGSASPAATLDVQGTTKLGNNGTILTEVIKLTVNHDIIPMLANGSALENIPVPNASIGSSVFVSPGTALQNGIVIAYARVSAAGIVEVRFINTTAGAINPPPMDFFITVIK